MKRLAPGGIATSSPLYIVMLGLLSALPPFGTDAGLPGLSSLQHAFGVDAAQAAQTLTIFLLGFAFGPVVFGPLSDQRGRKPVLLLGVALFVLGGIGCTFADSIDTLLLFRALQGVGAGAAAALPTAIVRDVFQGEQGLSRQSYVQLVNAVAPLVAPLCGAAFLALGGWRAIYGVIALLGIVLFTVCAFGYGETAPLRRNTRPGNAVASAVSGYGQLLRNRQYLLSTGVLAATFGTMFAYITASSSVFMTLLHASSSTFALLFATTAAGTICGAAFNARLSASIGAGRLIWVALTGTVLVSLLLLVTAFLGIKSIAVTAGCVVATNFCAGIVMPNAAHRALREAAGVAGSAAALQRSLQMLTGAAAGALFGLAGEDPLVAMACAMATFAVLALGLYCTDMILETRPDSTTAARASRTRGNR